MRTTAAILLCLLATGCGAAGETSGAPRPAAPAPLQRAEATTSSELRTTARALGIPAAGAPRRTEPSPCRQDGEDVQRFTGGHRLRVTLPREARERRAMLAGAARRWRAAGHRVRVRGGRFPAVLASARDGSAYALTLLPARGRAVLAGGTPCMPG